MDEDRLTHLEITVAHQQDLLQKLNEVLTEQQGTIDRLVTEVERMREIVSDLLQLDPQDRTTPPHY